MTLLRHDVSKDGGSLKSSDGRPIAGTAPIRDIEILRGLSILMVLVAHLHFLLPWPDIVFAATSKLKFGAGVDLFFAISGYVISASFWRACGRGSSARRIVFAFLTRRFFRLWPAAALVIAATWASSVIFSDNSTFLSWGDGKTTTISAIASLFNVMNYWGSALVRDQLPLTLFAHFWSLSLEEQFYLVFPAVALLAATPGRLAVVAGIAALMLAPSPRESIFDPAWWFRYDSLALGIVVFGLQTKGWLHVNARAALAIAPLGFVALLGSEALLGPSPLSSSLTSLGAAALVAVAADNRDRFRLPAVNGALTYLGSRSYAIYLWHILIFAWVKAAWLGSLSLPTQPSGIIIIGMTLSAILCLPVVELGYRLVERRSRNLGAAIASRIEAVRDKGELGGLDGPQKAQGTGT